VARKWNQGGQPESQVEDDAEVRRARELFLEVIFIVNRFCRLRGLCIDVMYNNEVPIDEAFFYPIDIV